MEYTCIGIKTRDCNIAKQKLPTLYTVHVNLVLMITDLVELFPHFLCLHSGLLLTLQVILCLLYLSGELTDCLLSFGPETCLLLSSVEREGRERERGRGREGREREREGEGREKGREGGGKNHYWIHVYTVNAVGSNQ